MGKNWSLDDVPDQTGKIIIVTGANDGIGFANTEQFAKKGALVVMACRNLDKGHAAVKEIVQAVPSAKLVLLKLDLANLTSVKQFVKEFKSKFDRLDVLLNNAGIMMVPYKKTVDGFESQVGTNHLGHFVLTALLFDYLKKTPGARVINVSSGGHRFGTMDFDDFLFENKYSRIKAYGRSKLANLLFTYELDRRFRAKNLDIKALASHPGVATTGLTDHMLPGPLKYISFVIMRIFFAQSSARGALPSSRAALDPNAKSGEYYGPKNWLGENRGPPTRVESNKESHNEEDAKKLWELSEKLTGTPFEI